MLSEDQLRASKRKAKWNPKTPKRLVQKVRKAIIKAMENNENIDTEQQKPDFDASKKELQLPLKVLVDKEQLNGLIAQNGILKDELEALIGVYMDIAPFFTADFGIMGIMKVLPKLMNDKTMQDKIAGIIPIIEKYKAASNGENKAIG